MKKLVAMLLALALVASFGVTAAFADYSFSNADSAKLYGLWIDENIDAQDFWGDVGALNSEVGALWQQYDLDMNDGTLSAAEKVQKTKEMEAQLKALKVDNDVNKLGLPAALFDITSDPLEAWQATKVIGADVGARKARQETLEAENTFWKSFYTKQAAADKARGEDNTAKNKALLAYLASDRTDVDKAIYDVAIANVAAQRALTNAKAAVADAKAEFAKAQSSWKSAVDVKVAEAQAEYYVAVADAYSAAVGDAVAAIYAALGA